MEQEWTGRLLAELQPAGMTTNSLREALPLLRAARSLLASSDNWTQGAWARTATGEAVLPDHKNAIAWCVSGSVLAADHRRNGSRVEVETTADPVPFGVQISGPKRIMTALRLLALPALGVFWRKVRDPGQSVRGRRAGEAGAPAGRETKVDLLEFAPLLAAAINDGQDVTFAEMTSVLELAIAGTADELARRRARGGGTP